MTEDLMRKQFEEFCKSIDISYQMSFGQYHSQKTQTYWWIWKESRKVLTVELPSADDFGDEEILFKYKELVEDKLMQAGITVKE